MNKRVTIITPTIGTDYLEKNLESISKQTYKNVQHLVVVDGNEYRDRADKTLKKFDDKSVMYLPENTGANNYNGHRIYGAMPFLINSDYVCFIDEDNWLEPEHVESLIEVANYYNWAFSLRKIVDKSGNFICNDDCENLGLWPTCLSDTEYFVDVGCYFLPTSLAIQTSTIWYRRARHPQEQPEVDRLLMKVLLQHKFTYQTNGMYTLNYRVGNRVDSVQAQFFIRGNEVMKQKYNGEYPWRKK